MDSKIIERMKRLLAMSQDSSSEHEAMIAARRLHVLMSKYNVSMSDIEEKEDVVGEGGFETVNFPYRRLICKSIAKLYYCDLIYQKTRKNYAVMITIGREQNRNIVESISKMVISMIDREAAKFSLEIHGIRDSHTISSFRNGAANRIYDRCMDLIEQARRGDLQDEDTGEKLPALASIYDRENQAVQDFLSSIKLQKKKSRTKANSGYAMAAGSAAGGKVPLHQQLSKTAPKALS